ncbi:MAG: RloB family protein [Chloroflexi bacterium]|nr:RloB family protein [Chloroflexota bacterium]
MFNDDNIHIEFLISKTGAPPKQVLTKMKQYLKNSKLRKDYEAWLISDKDNWDESELAKLYQWSQTKENYGFALSNPSFEYWLLLHFEDGKKICNQQKCKERLKRYLPGYDKKIDPHKFNGKFHEAVRRAKEKDKPRCKDWPRSTGTTVYRIVEKFL